MKSEQKRILIFGSNGMLGQRLVEFYSTFKNVEILSSSVEEMSFFTEINYKQIELREKSQIIQIINEFQPQVVINVAAFTNVDLSETQRELAYQINTEAVKIIAIFCKKIDAHFIHISTDYVFDGENGPYSETDLTNPIGYYGETKLESEREIQKSEVKSTIIRTNVLYGTAKFGRPDFVKWVVQSLKSGKEINIVADQIGNPTFLDDLVQAIYLAENKQVNGLFNIGGKEFLSRYDFTLKIADFFNLSKEKINKITTESLNQIAKRPLKSGLKIEKAITELGYKPHSIAESLQKMKDELGF